MILTSGLSLCALPAAICAAAPPQNTTVNESMSVDDVLSATQAIDAGAPIVSRSVRHYYRLPAAIDESTGILANAITALKATPSNGEAILRFSVGSETLETIAAHLRDVFSIRAGEIATPLKAMSAGLNRLYLDVINDWAAANKDYPAVSRFQALARQVGDEWVFHLKNHELPSEPKTLVLQAWGAYDNQKLLNEIRIQIGAVSQDAASLN